MIFKPYFLRHEVAGWTLWVLSAHTHRVSSFLVFKISNGVLRLPRMVQKGWALSFCTRGKYSLFWHLAQGSPHSCGSTVGSKSWNGMLGDSRRCSLFFDFGLEDGPVPTCWLLLYSQNWSKASSKEGAYNNNKGFMVHIPCWD